MKKSTHKTILHISKGLLVSALVFQLAAACGTEDSLVQSSDNRSSSDNNTSTIELTEESLLAKFRREFDKAKAKALTTENTEVSQKIWGAAIATVAVGFALVAPKAFLKSRYKARALESLKLTSKDLRIVKHITNYAEKAQASKKAKKHFVIFVPGFDAVEGLTAYKSIEKLEGMRQLDSAFFKDITFVPMIDQKFFLNPSNHSAGDVFTYTKEVLARNAIQGNPSSDMLMDYYFAIKNMNGPDTQISIVSDSGGSFVISEARAMLNSLGEDPLTVAIGGAKFARFKGAHLTIGAAFDQLTKFLPTSNKYELPNVPTHLAYLDVDEPKQILSYLLSLDPDAAKSLSAKNLKKMARSGKIHRPISYRNYRQQLIDPHHSSNLIRNWSLQKKGNEDPVVAISKTLKREISEMEAANFVNFKKRLFRSQYFLEAKKVNKLEKKLNKAFETRKTLETTLLEEIDMILQKHLEVRVESYKSMANRINANRPGEIKDENFHRSYEVLDNEINSIYSEIFLDKAIKIAEKEFEKQDVLAKSLKNIRPIEAFKTLFTKYAPIE